MKDGSRLDVMSISEIARRLGVSRLVVSQWRHRGKLPPPDVKLEIGPVWKASTIEAWIVETKPRTGGGATEA